MCYDLSSLVGKIVYLITDCKGKWVKLDLTTVGRQGQEKWEEVICMQLRIRLQVLRSVMCLEVS